MSIEAQAKPYNPAQFYHVSGDARVVTSAADEAALGAGWFDSPKKAKAAADEAAAAKKPAAKKE